MQGFFLCRIFAFVLGIILNIETSTKNCSVSISNGAEIIQLKELNTGGYSHAEKLHPFIQDCMQAAGITFSDLDGVCVGKGPGSYTGLRIGVSAAKGLCFANDLPLMAVNSLEILARSQTIDSGVIVPLIDARRMEVYSAVFDSQFNWIRETQAEIINASSFASYLEKGSVYFVGDGAEKCKDVITHKNAHFINNEFPSAKNMVHISTEKLAQKDVEDVAYFEPYYLKNFVATPEKKKL
jgi:tRNA threonylcarbamoyladenosine biosynthesis protein TsaB